MISINAEYSIIIDGNGAYRPEIKEFFENRNFCQAYGWKQIGDSHTYERIVPPKHWAYAIQPMDGAMLFNDADHEVATEFALRFL